MHEVGIAASIIEIAEAAARDRGNAPIRAIGLRLGAFTGVVREALEFAYEALRTGTLASQARLEIHEVPVTGACPDCGWSGPPVEDFCLICPQCHSPVKIISGREMQVEYVDLDIEACREGEMNNATNHARKQGPPQERRMGGSQSPAV